MIPVVYSMDTNNYPHFTSDILSTANMNYLCPSIAVHNMSKNKKGKVISMPSTAEGYFESGRARKLPIYECLINEGWEDAGFAHITISRKHVNGNLSWAVFLVDTYCLGVKSCFYIFNEPASAYQEQKESLPDSLEMQACDYPLAHNIIYGAVEFANDFGFSPHKDFKVAQYILEEDDDSVELIDIDFGKDGKPLYVSGPYDDPAKKDQVLATLTRTAGKGNFHFIMDEDDIEDEDDDELLDGVWDEEEDTNAFFAPGEMDEILDQGKVPDLVQSFIMTQRIYNHYFKDKESSIGITMPRDLDILTLLEYSIPENEEYFPSNEKEEEVIESLINDEGEIPLAQQIEHLDHAVEQFPHIFDLYGTQILLNESDQIPLKEDFGKIFSERFPGTPFSKILQASLLYSRGNIEGALSIFNNEYKIQDCFPEREGQFTESEIFHFMALMSQCYTAKGDMATAKVFAQTILKFGDENEIYFSIGWYRLSNFMLEKIKEIGPE